MLHNIVFQDNLYLLTRSIENTHDGLLLDISPDYFYEKVSADISFFDSCISQIHAAIQKHSKISDYVSLMKAMHACQEKYIALLDLILERRAPIAEAFANDMVQLQVVKNRHTALLAESSASITKSKKSGDARDIVSTSELSELLNFEQS